VVAFAGVPKPPGQPVATDSPATTLTDEAQALIAAGRLDEAETTLASYISDHPRAATLIYLLGVVELLQGRLREAEVTINRAYAVKPWLMDLPPRVLDLRPVLLDAVARRPRWEWAHYHLERSAFQAERDITLDSAVTHALARADVSLVQVGANDGQRGDPVRPFISQYGWRALLIEPLPEPFALLSRRYARDERIAMANVAIAETDGELTLYVKPGTRTTTASALPKRNVLGREAGLRPVTVEALTFGTVFARHGVERVDLLQIDTEGYDYRVLRTFDLERYRPAIVNLEYYCLPIRERLATCELLRDAGYGYVFGRMDLLAVDLDVFGDAFGMVDTHAETRVRIPRRSATSKTPSKGRVLSSSGYIRVRRQIARFGPADAAVRWLGKGVRAVNQQVATRRSDRQDRRQGSGS